ncbi:multicopper oxidase [Lentithecium fluviatile CBS 122367]|uniref:Multicopper oxidase n=1 Tax=Lentithecium fluviatile CBS 122367 TaxID=1168545 RepID=A0A6G1JIL7_9PLEO|nr:multicopper oxidase [Lentithecium fluviatile CBS 122367]
MDPGRGSPNSYGVDQLSITVAQAVSWGLAAVRKRGESRLPMYQFCGSAEQFCGAGCLHGFGDCSTNSTSVASNLTATATRNLTPRATTESICPAINETMYRTETPRLSSPHSDFFRIINGAIQSSYKFYIDVHQLEVINMGFTSIQPYTTDVLSIEIAQRYMWMRADNQNTCATTLQADDIKGIVHYSGSNSTAVPTSTKRNYTGGCVDEPLASLIPMAQLNPTNSDVSFTKDDTIAANSDLLFKWYLSGTTLMSRNEDPTLVRVLANGTAPTYSGDLIPDLPEMCKWIYIIVESAIPLNHPIHLHGHDFFILVAGSGSYSSSTPLNLVNPPRRDTASMHMADAWSCWVVYFYGVCAADCGKGGGRVG